MRLHPRPHTSWFFHDNGYMRAWLVILMWLVVLGIVAYGAYWIYVLATEPTCSAPYHLVYTGTHLELVGKVMVNMDQYACVGN